MKPSTYFLILATLLTGCLSTPDPPPKHRIDYFGNNTFRWARHQGLGLVSYSPGGNPSIRSDGGFVQREVQLALANENGDILAEIYEPLAGDDIDVNFADFESNGTLTVTRSHRGLPYVRDLIEARSDGLEVMDHERLPIPDANPEDVLTYGKRYFEQDQAADLEEAKTRFFHAGAKYPKLGVRFLRQLDNRAEQEGNSALALEILNYRDRFELLEDLQLAPLAQE